jgi:Tfp pilus assembly protein FimT
MHLRCRKSRGITLLELLLVMAMLVAITALAAPQLAGPLENHRLRKGADQVRTAWSKARVQAMDSGRTFAFRYQPTSNQFLVEPWSADEDYLESAQVTVSGMATPMTQVPVQQDLSYIEPEALPDKIVFTASETEADMRDAMLAQQQLPDGTDGQWSSPVFFYPDGTASTARLVLANSRQCHIMLTLRGLTGVVHVSDILAAEELP